MTTGPVLVIEDHADTRHMIEEYLRFEGIPSVGAENGMQGLTALREYQPSVVLLDLSMPVMDGFRFREEQLRLAEGHLAGIPVVVLSAFNDCQRHAQRMGAADAIPKPIDFDHLLSVVRKYQ